MTGDQEEFRNLLQRIGAGSQDAVREFVELYGEHILRIVRHKLDNRLRTWFDSQDFVQSVWASFFALPLDDYHFDRPEDLVAFLTQLARTKVIRVARQRFIGQKHNINRERPFDELRTAPTEYVRPREPTAEEIAMAREEWQRLLETQPAEYQRLLVLLRGGQTQQEAAEELGLTERTIRRIIAKIAAETAHDYR